jgi:hypothetical protein
MGLDMYLTARKFYSGSKGQRPMEDGFELEAKDFAAGYWRKHPNLHGLIVEQFNGGIDNCQDIDLAPDDIEKIITAVSMNLLPHTDGFFFGNSTGEEKDEDLEIFRKALDWLNKKEDGVWKSIIYRASW